MTAYKLQFIIPSSLILITELYLIVWNGFDKLFTDIDKNNINKIKYTRIFWAIFYIFLGVTGIINTVLDGPVMGYIIPPPN